MYTHRYRLNDEELEHVFEEKDLGVVIGCDLEFEQMILLVWFAVASRILIVRFSRSCLLRLLAHIWSMSRQCGHHTSKMFKSEQPNLWTVLVTSIMQIGCVSSIYGHLRTGERGETWLSYIKPLYKPTLSKSFQPQFRSTRRHDSQQIWHRPKDGAHRTSMCLKTCLTTFGRTTRFVLTKSYDEVVFFCLRIVHLDYY